MKKMRNESIYQGKLWAQTLMKKFGKAYKILVIAFRHFDITFYLYSILYKTYTDTDTDTSFFNKRQAEVISV